MSTDTEFANRLVIELSRGCPCQCGFCLEGHIGNPVRFRSPDVLLSTIHQVLPPDIDRLGLLGFSVSSYPRLDELLEGLEELEPAPVVSISSLRIKDTPERLVRFLARQGAKTLAIAPEAGSQRLRDMMGKRLSEEEILNGVELVLRQKIPNIRLYFIVGLPTETDEDIEGIVLLVQKIKKLMLKFARQHKRIGRLLLSVSFFVPKPHTPFERFPFTRLKELKRRQKILKVACSRMSNVDISFDSARWSYLQSIISRGDETIAPLLLAAAKQPSSPNMRHMAGRLGLDLDNMAYQTIESDKPLVWDCIRL